MHQFNFHRLKKIDVRPVREYEAGVTPEGYSRPAFASRSLYLTDVDGTTVELTLFGDAPADIALPGDPVPAAVPHDGDATGGGPVG